jgi:phage-related protein
MFQAGDNLPKRITKGLNDIQADFVLTFSQKSEDEAKSFLHFFEEVESSESGVFSFNTPSTSGVEIAFPTGGIYKNLENLFIKDYKFKFHNGLFDIDLALSANHFSSLLDWRGSCLVTGSGLGSVWETGASYEKFDITYFTGQGYKIENRLDNYRYCIENHVSSGENSPTGSGSAWEKTFFFQPDDEISIGANNSNKIKTLGQSRSIYTKTNYNDGLIKGLALDFKNRSNKETIAILHFLEKHGSLKSFQMSIPQLYTKNKFFVAKDWSHKFVYKDCNDITVRMDEIVQYSDAMTERKEAEKFIFQEYSLSVNPYNVSPTETMYFNFSITSGGSIEVPDGKEYKYDIDYSNGSDYTTGTFTVTGYSGSFDVYRSFLTGRPDLQYWRKMVCAIYDPDVPGVAGDVKVASTNLYFEGRLNSHFTLYPSGIVDNLGTQKCVFNEYGRVTGIDHLFMHGYTTDRFGNENRAVQFPSTGQVYQYMSGQPMFSGDGATITGWIAGNDVGKSIASYMVGSDRPTYVDEDFKWYRFLTTDGLSRIGRDEFTMSWWERRDLGTMWPTGAYYNPSGLPPWPLSGNSMAVVPYWEYADPVGFTKGYDLSGENELLTIPALSETSAGAFYKSEMAQGPRECYVKIPDDGGALNGKTAARVLGDNPWSIEEIPTTGGPNYGTWNHWCYTFKLDGASIPKLYKNGRVNAEGSAVLSGLVTFGWEMFVGYKVATQSTPPGDDNYRDHPGWRIFSGSIDDITIFDEYLNEREVYNLYNVQKDWDTYTGWTGSYSITKLRPDPIT